MKTARKFMQLFAAIALLAITPYATAENKEPDKKKSLVERLGFPPNARVLIINADDFGMNHATNVGTFKAMKAGGLTSSTIMVPCPWFLEAAQFAKQNPQANLGVHLTLTSEWKRYKWGPVAGRSAVPSLVDNLGYFYTDVLPVYFKAKLEEVEKEVRAQIQRALAAGIDVTHIDSHMGTLQYDLKYHELYIRIAKDYNLPCRIAGPDLMEPRGGGYLIKMAADLGVLHPDMLYLGDPNTLEDTQRFWSGRLKQLQPGEVSEIFIHCGQETHEMKATCGSWRRRSADTKYFSSRKWLDAIKAEGIYLISYRQLRQLQRTGKALPHKEFYGW